MDTLTATRAAAGLDWRGQRIIDPADPKLYRFTIGQRVWLPYGGTWRPAPICRMTGAWDTVTERTAWIDDSGLLRTAYKLTGHFPGYFVSGCSVRLNPLDD